MFVYTFCRVVVTVVTFTVLAACRHAAGDEQRPQQAKLDAPSGESRALLDGTYNWLTTEQAELTLSRVKGAGFNVFIPAVWKGRGTTWPSQLAPPSPEWREVRRKGVDPLAEMIRIAHAKGIEVHPWITLSKRRGEWLGKYFDKTTADGFFNIHDPAFRDFIVNLVSEVVKNYDIDGLNLDFVRAGPKPCRAQLCIDSYLAFSGRDLLKDIRAHKKSQEAWESIAAWNGQTVDSMIRAISVMVRATRPDIILSVDSHAAMEHLRFQGANSVKWANAGWIDVIFHMEYRRLEDIREGLLATALQKLDDPDKLVLMVGNYVWTQKRTGVALSRDAEETVRLLERSRATRPNGNGLALYQYSLMNESQYEAIRKGPFAVPAAPDWKKYRNVDIAN